MHCGANAGITRSGAEVSGRIVRDKTPSPAPCGARERARRCRERALGCGSAYYWPYFAGHSGRTWRLPARRIMMTETIAPPESPAAESPHIPRPQTDGAALRAIEEATEHIRERALKIRENRGSAQTQARPVPARPRDQHPERPGPGARHPGQLRQQGHAGQAAQHPRMRGQDPGQGDPAPAAADGPVQARGVQRRRLRRGHHAARAQPHRGPSTRTWSISSTSTGRPSWPT